MRRIYLTIYLWLVTSFGVLLFLLPPNGIVGPVETIPTVREFHNMLQLPSHYLTNKISFRSCISHTSETVIADISGSGCIKLLWLVTGMGAAKTRPEHCTFTKDALMMMMRIYFDGSPTPSIEAPLGPMFGIHHNLNDSWGNLESGYGADNSMFRVSENGALSLIAPMPFSNGCRITLQDKNPDHSVKMRVWAQVSYHQYQHPIAETLRLHAIYSQQDLMHRYNPPKDTPHRYKRSFHVGHSSGSGYLLGFTMGLTVKDHNDQWFHNGGEMIIIDHTTNPRVMKGTGGEDFFGTSCSFSLHHNFPDWGFMYGNGNSLFSAYRFFVNDFQIRFHSEFSVDYGTNRDAIETVLYWYQDGPTPNEQLILTQPRVIPRLGESPGNSMPDAKPPTGVIPLWEFTEPVPLHQWSLESSQLHYVVNVEPIFGFVSIGEHFFRYQTNEGYPVMVMVHGKAILHSSDEGATFLTITHDDQFMLFLNEELVYESLEPTFGFHSFPVPVTLKIGNNTLRCKVGNTENSNTRAWVFGLTLNTNEPNRQHVQPIGHNSVIDGACE